MKVLFVCKGNHGRSQIAEAIFNHLSLGKHEAISAGIRVVREDANKEGQKVSAVEIIQVMKEMGIDVSAKIRNQVTPEMVEGADKVVVMAQAETIPDFLKENKKVIYWDVPDPAGQSIEFARGVRDKLKSMISDFIETSSELKPNTRINLH